MATYPTRTVTNASEPFTHPDGSPLVGVEVRFTIVDARGRKVSAIDATTKEHVAGSALAVTDNTGVFSIDLWPNDRGHISTGYLVEYRWGGFKKFTAGLPEAVGSISITDLETGSATLVGQELNSLIVHSSDASIHFDEPPSDGIYYVRRNGLWADASSAFVTTVLGVEVVKLAITAIANEYLTCTEADTPTNTYYVARPDDISSTYTAHDGLTFTYSGVNTRNASDGSTTEEQALVPPYMVGDLIMATSPVQYDDRSISVGGTPTDATDMWHDLNITGRQWAKTV